MSAKKYYEVKIPCRPYVRKFVTTLFGQQIKADQSSTLGCLINLSLDKNIYEQRNFKSGFLYRGLEDNLVLLINRWQFDSLGFDIATDKVIIINRFIENWFAEMLYMHVRNHTHGDSRYKGYKQAIEAFADMYGIDLEFDITYDGLKKMEYRWRKSLEPAAA